MNNLEIDSGTLRRAKKIFALANNNPSAEEAAAAMGQVEKMMAKYGLTYDDLKDDTVKKQFGESSSEVRKSPFPNWYRWLASAVANLTETRSVTYEGTKRYTMRFQGINGDNEVALMTLEYLVDTMNRCLKIYKKENDLKGASVSLDFRRGFALAICKRAREIKQEREAIRREQETTGTSLSVIKMDLIGGHFNDVRIYSRKPPAVKLKDESAYGAGRDAGNNTSLNNQVENGSPSQNQLSN